MGWPDLPVLPVKDLLLEVTPYLSGYVTQRKGRLILIWGKCHQEVDQSYQRIIRVIDYFLHFYLIPFWPEKGEREKRTAKLNLHSCAQLATHATQPENDRHANRFPHGFSTARSEVLLYCTCRQ